MITSQKLDTKLVALQAAITVTLLPIWRALTPEDMRGEQIDTLKEMARNGDDFYTNREYSQLVAIEMRRWADILAQASQSPVTPPLEPVG